MVVKMGNIALQDATRRNKAARKTYYVRSAEEIIKTDGRLWEHIFLPRPDISKREFFR